MYFASSASTRALDTVIAAHFVRQGHPELAQCMQKVQLAFYLVD